MNVNVSFEGNIKLLKIFIQKILQLGSRSYIIYLIVFTILKPHWTKYVLNTIKNIRSIKK